MQCNITRSLYSRRHCLDAANSGMGELALHAKTPSQKCTAQTSPILSPYLPLTMTVAHTVPVFFDITIVRVKFVNKGNPVKNGTVSNTAESPVGGRPLCEARPNVVRQLYFSKIAVRSAIRSTLLTAERLAAASEGRMSYIAFGNSRAGGVSGWCARVPSSLVLSVTQKVQDITTIRKNRKQIKGKFAVKLNLYLYRPSRLCR